MQIIAERPEPQLGGGVSAHIVEMAGLFEAGDLYVVYLGNAGNLISDAEDGLWNDDYAELADSDADRIRVEAGLR